MIRMQKHIILDDLDKKLVLLVGPRQSGKTWLAKDIAKSFKNSIYLNYDQEKDRRLIHEQLWGNNTELLILDELHKMPYWKNYLKGLFDTKPQSMRILVTGSARLDIYNKIGDSLAGRFFKHTLLPISLAECKRAGENVDIDRLIEYGGFPEPFFAEDAIQATRWRSQYIDSLLSTDIFDIDLIQNMKAMRLIFELLRYRVGSPVSYQSLSEDAQVSPVTVKKYIQILEALYIIFTVTPYSKNIARSLVKEPKIYFFDAGLVEGDKGAKFENMVAVSLFKSLSAQADMTGERHNLHYLRTKDGLEVDFALVKNDKIETMIECKYSEDSASKTLVKFREKYGYPAIQLVKLLRHDYCDREVSMKCAENFLSELFL